MTDPRYINCGPSDDITAPGDLYGYLRLRLERPLVYWHFGPRDMRADVDQFTLDVADKANDLVAPVEAETGVQADSPFALLDLRSYSSGATITVAELVARLEPVAKNLSLLIATIERIAPEEANAEARDAAAAAASEESQGQRGALDSLTASAKWAIVALVAVVLLIVAGETKKLVT